MAINFLNTVAVDDSVLFVDTVNDRVGIGTDSPKTKLHVQGASATEVPIVRIGGFGNSGAKLELAETLSGDNMNYGFSFFNDGNSSNTLIIKAHNNSATGVTAMTIDRGNALTTFGPVPVVGTRTAGDNSTRAASTAFVNTAVALVSGLPVNNPTFTGTLTGPSVNITGNTLLGNSNGDYVHVNDKLFVGATDSGNAEFWFGEGTTGDVNYGAHWAWDSLYTHNWFTVDNSSETLMMSYDVNNTSRVRWYRDIDIQDNDIVIDSGHGFVNSGAWTRNQTPSGYIDFGPANAGHAHIYTDRPNFYFNKSLTVGGSSIVNQNDIRSKKFYDVDNVAYYADFGSGQIVLGGTGRIQGIDTVSAGTDAANKTYVDNAVAGRIPISGSVSMNTASGIKSFYSQDVMNTASGDQSTLEIYQDTAGADAFMQFHIGGDYAAYFGLAGDSNDFEVGGWSMGATKYRVLHQGNSIEAWNLNQELTTSSSPTFNTITANGSIYVNWNDASSDIYMQDSNEGSRRIHCNSNYIGFLKSDNNWGFRVHDNGNTYTAGTASFPTDIYVGDQIIHDGDTNTYLQFHAADQFRVVTGGTERFEVNNSNVTVAGNLNTTSMKIGNGVELRESSDRADLLQLTSLTSGWAGLQIRNSSNEGRWSFMTDGSTAGFYDDENNDWAVQMVENNAVKLYYNAAQKFQTNSTGVAITGNASATGVISAPKFYVPTLSASTTWAFQARNSASTADSGIHFDSGNSEVLLRNSSNSLTGRLRSNGSSYFNGGNLGIGTTSPLEKLEVQGTIYATPISYASNQNAYVFKMGANNNTAFDQGIKIKSTSGGVSYMSFNSRNEDTLVLRNATVGIGTASPQATLHVDNPQTSSNNIGVILEAAAGGYSTINMKVNLPNYGEGIRLVRSGTYSGNALKFFNNTSQVGSVFVNTSSTSYNTTSDYRSKENVVPMENSINRLKELKPCRFNFIIEPENTVDGFIAHEAQEVVPESVTGEKDKLDFEGNPEYQGIDQSKLVPLLTSALQEAIDKIEQLETRIQTLENN